MTTIAPAAPSLAQLLAPYRGGLAFALATCERQRVRAGHPPWCADCERRRLEPIGSAAA